MKMSIKQDKGIYLIDIKDGLYILKHQLWLRFRRFLRLGKRIYNYMKSLSVVFIFALIFILVMIPTGIRIEKYSSWSNGLWDMRFFLLTSIFITLFSTIYTSELKRHDILKRQNNMYNDFLFECELFIKNLCNSIGFNYNEHIFITEKHSMIFLSHLNNYILSLDFCETPSSNINNLSEFRKKIIYHSSISKRFEVHVKIMYSYITNEKIIGFNKYRDRRNYVNLIPDLYNEQIVIQNVASENYNNEIVEFINTKIFWNMFYALASLRRPWRWDYQRNQTIRQLLSRKGEMIHGYYDYTKLWIL